MTSGELSRKPLRASTGRLAIVICPSNPYFSVDPILALSGLRDWIKATGAPVVAVLPIVDGAAIRGPAAEIMRELGLQPFATSVARHYNGLVDDFVIDRADVDSSEEIASMGMRVLSTQTVMQTMEDRVGLARECLALAEDLLRGTA